MVVVLQQKTQINCYYYQHNPPSVCFFCLRDFLAHCLCLLAGAEDEWTGHSTRRTVTRAHKSDQRLKAHSESASLFHISGRAKNGKTNAKILYYVWFKAIKSFSHCTERHCENCIERSRYRKLLNEKNTIRICRVEYERNTFCTVSFAKHLLLYHKTVHWTAKF